MDTKKGGTIITSVLCVVAVLLSIFVLLGQITVDLGMLVGGVVLVISGLVQRFIAKDTEDQVIQQETYKIARYSLIIGVVMLVLIGLKVLLQAMN